MDLGRPVTFSKVVLGEYLPCGQHIELSLIHILHRNRSSVSSGNGPASG